MLFVYIKTKIICVLFQSESGIVSKKDFQFVLRELGDITDNAIIDEIFAEVDVDGNGIIDYDEFTFMVRNYMTDDDIATWMRIE